MLNHRSALHREMDIQELSKLLNLATMINKLSVEEEMEIYSYGIFLQIDYYKKETSKYY